MKKKKRIWIRVLALFLVFTLVAGYWASAMINIKIASDASDVAIKYLAENTEYVNANRSARFLNLVQSLKKADSIEEYYLAASMRIGSAKYEEALYYIDQVLQMSSETRYKEMYIDALVKKGCLLTLLDKNEEAVEALETAIMVNPDNPEIYLVLAQIYLETEELDKLEEVLSSYLNIHPDDLEIRVTYIQTLQALDKEDEVTLECLKVIGHPDVSADQKDDAYYILAINSFKKEDFTKSLEYMEKVLDYDGRYPDLYYNKGICYMSTGDFETAKATFSESIAKGINLQECYYSRAVIEFTFEDGDYRSAYDDLILARDYEGEDRDEETALLASQLLETAFVVEEDEG